MPDSRRLRAFDKISLNPGEIKTVNLKIPANDLAFVNENGKWTIEAGEFMLQVGNLTAKINCTTTKIWEKPNR